MEARIGGDNHSEPLRIGNLPLAQHKFRHKTKLRTCRLDLTSGKSEW